MTKPAVANPAPRNDGSRRILVWATWPRTTPGKAPNGPMIMDSADSDIEATANLETRDSASDAGWTGVITGDVESSVRPSGGDVEAVEALCRAQRGNLRTKKYTGAPTTSRMMSTNQSALASCS